MADAALVILTTVLVLGGIGFLGGEVRKAYRDRAELGRRVLALERIVMGQAADPFASQRQQAKPRPSNGTGLPSYEVLPDGNVLWSDGSITTMQGQVVRDPMPEEGQPHV